MRFHAKIAALPLLALGLSVSTPALAEQQEPLPTDAAAAPEQQPDEGYFEDDNEIVVTAVRPRGGVETDVAPVDELSEADVQSMGASSIEDVLGILAPQTGSGRGRGSGGPVILLNGKRISSFRELRDIPPEAIERIQVFPEEVALQYGYRPDQRVVNFILKENFASANMEVELGGPDRGGQPRREVSGAFTQIGKKGRFNVAGSYQFQGLLTEDERGIVADGSEQFPYALAGNVTGVNGGAIDPALGTATVAGVPNGTPTLAQFAGTAGVANSDDTTPYRTLTAETNRWRVNATWNRTLSSSTDLTINGSYELNESRSLLGLANESFLLPGTSPFSPFDGDVIVNRSFADRGALQRRSTTSTAEAGVGMNGLIGEKWRWNATANFSSADSRSLTTRGLDTAVLEAAVAAGTANPFASDFGSGLFFAAADEARTLANTLTTSAVFNGTLFRLPAGEIQSTVRVGYARTDLESTSLRSNNFQATSLGRDDADASINVNLPIADSREDVLGFLGRFSINANVGYHELSDFGGLVSYGVGFVWAPTNRLSITGSYIGDEKAPSVGDLGNPVVVTPNVATYDAVRGETVLATITSGGNPGLRSESREDLKFGINWQPPVMDNFNIQLEYFRNRASDVTNAFPLLTSAIEAAFPGRVTRDASGRLIALDERSINFGRTFSDSLRFGLNIGGNIGKQPEGEGPMGAGGPRGPGGPGGGPRAGGGRPGGGGPRMGGMGGGPGRFGGGQGGGRWMLGLAYTYHIREEVEIASGLPILDLLDGDTVGSGGGQGRHELSLEGGVFYKGFGARVSGTYESATRVDGNTLTGTSDLYFSDLAKINLRLFADLDQQKWLTDKVSFLKGSRISLGIDNVFDTIQDVRDGTGAVPLRYQPGFVDPAGRVFEIEFRKRF